jgi:hypothetical protein
LTETSITVNIAGTFNFQWDYYTNDADPSYDPAYYINGIAVQLTNDVGPNSQTGSISFFANAGDVIGFGIDATDGCCGESHLLVRNFTYPDDICGCTDPLAVNYDPLATFDDGSCLYTTCLGDFNGDGLRNTADLLIFLADFGCPAACIADMNGDTVVNTSDLLIFLSVFGVPC